MSGSGDGSGDGCEKFSLKQYFSKEECPHLVLRLSVFGVAVLLLLLAGLMIISVCCLACKIRRLKRQANSSNKAVVNQSCVDTGDYLVTSEMNQSVNMSGEMEEKAVVNQSCVGASDHLVMSEMNQSVDMSGEMEENMYDAIVNTEDNPKKFINGEAVLLPCYDIVGQVDESNGRKMPFRNPSGIIDQEDRSKAGGMMKSKKQDEYSVVKKVTKSDGEYNCLVHCAESYSTFKNADIPIRASVIYQQEYASIEKTAPSSLQVNKVTDHGQLCKSGRGSPSPPPVPPPIDQKDLPDGMLGLETEVAQVETKQQGERLYYNMVIVKADVSVLPDPVDNQQRDGRKSPPGMEIYMNVNVV